eukprot:75730-Rhodomonas_salina.1
MGGTWRPWLWIAVSAFTADISAVNPSCSLFLVSLRAQSHNNQNSQCTSGFRVLRQISIQGPGRVQGPGQTGCTCFA